MFIVFEGPDGCGKSSMIDAVRRHFAVMEIDAIFVHDPGSTDIGLQLRKVLLNPKNQRMCPMTELLLYVASRAQMVAEIIRPALEQGKVVISDRYIISTLVYQGVSKALPEDELKQVVNLGLGGALADHVILLDVPAHIGLERVGKEMDRMEEKGLEFHEEVRQRYLGYADGAPAGTVYVVDASQTLLAVKKKVLEIIDAILQ